MVLNELKHKVEKTFGFLYLYLPYRHQVTWLSIAIVKVTYAWGSTNTNWDMKKQNANMRVKDSIKEFTVPTLSHCMHECIWHLQENCFAMSYHPETQFCAIADTTDLVPSSFPIQTFTGKLFRSKL